MRALLATTFLLLANSASAETLARNADWIVERLQNGQLTATTENSDGNFFGKTCTSEGDSCAYVLIQNTRCTQGGQTAGLINSSAGTLNVKLSCVGQLNAGRDAKYVFYFDKSEDLEQVIYGASGVTGVAFGLESGQFAVQRFSMNGAPIAVTRLSAEVEKIKSMKRKQPDKESTKGQYL